MGDIFLIFLIWLFPKYAIINKYCFGNEREVSGLVTNRVTGMKCSHVIGELFTATFS
jgi:uncharacterized membrane protein (GlpM family)